MKTKTSIMESILNSVVLQPSLSITLPTIFSRKTSAQSLEDVRFGSLNQISFRDTTSNEGHVYEGSKEHLEGLPLKSDSRR